MVCPRPGAFDVSEFVDVVTRHRVTLCSVVPTMLMRLLAEPDFVPPFHLRGVLVGGAPSSVGLTRGARARGVPILRSYGMTETCAQVATDHPYELHDGDGGLPFLPGVEARLVGGVLEVRGPMLFSGYLGGPRISPSEWHRTQDLAVLNAEGRVAVLGRADDLIVSGGEKIAPLEVERVVEAVPGVRRACVFGMPDAVWGEVVCLAIEGDASEEALVHAFETTLAAYKRPRRLSVLPSFPEFASGKVDRVAVRATAAVSLRPLGKGNAP
jgi:O-succinylbenzoic acid--CoA ligase